MTMRASIFASAIFGAVAMAWLPGNPIAAAPAKAALRLTPPLAAAHTIQVTETVFEAGNGSAPGPLRQAGTMTFRVELPDKFRVEWKENDPTKPGSVWVSDGKTMVSRESGRTRTQSADSAELPMPLVGLLNNITSPVSAVPAVRERKSILLVITQLAPGGRQESWLDPKTHLRLRDTMFITWQGKTSAVWRADYSGWLLNKPLPASIFRLPVPDGKPK